MRWSREIKITFNFVFFLGIVKKVVELGGWHWLVLTSGIEVKLQRNDLSVIEAQNLFDGCCNLW